jgi:hypothetical protein
VLRAEHLFRDGERSPHQRGCLCEIALVVAQRGQVVEAAGGVGIDICAMSI